MPIIPTVSNSNAGSPATIGDLGVTTQDLVRSVWRHKWLVVSCTIVGLLIALAYLLIAPRAYQVEALIKPVSPANFQRIPLPPVKFQVTPASAFDLVKHELESHASYARFVKDHPELFRPRNEDAHGSQLASRMLSPGHITVGETRALNDPTTSVYLRISYPPDLNGVAIANGFLHFAIDRAKKKGAKALYETIAVERLSLRQQINAKRLNRIDQLRSDALFLKEQLAIATALHLDQPKLPSTFNNIIFNGKDPQRIDQMYPAYFRGAITLHTQLATVRDELASSKSWLTEIEKDPLNQLPIEMLPGDYKVAGLPQLVQEARQLADFRLDLDKIDVVDITQDATATTQLARPRRRLILGLGIALGLLVGLYWALFRTIVRRRYVK